MKTAFRIILFIITFLVTFSCKKDPEIVPVEEPIEEQIIPDSTVAKVYGKVELVFVPMIGNQPLYMNTTYTSKLNEQFALHAFSFFVDNLGVNNFEGKEKPLISAMPSGVHLIDFTRPNFDASHGLQSVMIKLETDTGKYSGLSFDIGVSRELNNSDPTLAPAPLDSATHKGMYWGWDSGYIFMFIEGSGADVYNNKFHLTMGKRQGIIPFTYGGFGPSRFKVEEGKTTRIFIAIDFLEILTNQDGSGYTLSESGTANVHGGPNSLILRNNTIKALEHISTQYIISN